MAQLRNRITGQVRSSQQVEREIRARVSCGPVINYDAHGEDVVFDTPQPTYDPITQSVREIAPVLNALGQYAQGWEVVALDAATVAANQANSALQAREAAKQARTAAVEAITVTTSTGKVFDGNPQSLQFLTSAYVAGSANNIATTPWTLADNSRVEVTLAEIKEAMTLAGLEISRLWAL